MMLTASKVSLIELLQIAARNPGIFANSSISAEDIQEVYAKVASDDLQNILDGIKQEIQKDANT